MTMHNFFPVLFLLAAAACTPEGQLPAHSTDMKVPQGIAAEYSAFEVAWPRPISTDVAARAGSLAEVMLGERLRESPFSDQLARAADSTQSAMSAELGASAVEVIGEYRRGANEIVLTNRTLQLSAASSVDVGEDAARARFVEVLRELGDAGVLDASAYDTNGAIVSRTLEGTGSSDTEEQVERVVSYDFLARRSLNGIPFVNSGVRVSVHPSGAIASIRVGGAGVAALEANGKLLPQTPGYGFKAVVDEAYYRSRFAQDYPRAQLKSAGLMYMLPYTVDPGAGQKQVVEPKFVFSFTNRFGKMVGRIKYVAYSIADPTQPPQDLSVPAQPEATGDPRPSQAPAAPNGTVNDSPPPTR